MERKMKGVGEEVMNEEKTDTDMEGGRKCETEPEGVRERERESELWYDEDMTHKHTHIFSDLVNRLRNILFNITAR